MLNIIFIIFIVLSFVAYLFYKTKQFRVNLPIRKKWYKAKAGIALGIFVIAFGINTSIVYPTAIGYAITVIFVIIGFMEAYASFKRASHEGKFVKEEYELNK
ncbi:YtpI family protein [Ureibacillus composti]|nr:YtpI family protein [Ureibacillus composti]